MKTESVYVTVKIDIECPSDMTLENKGRFRYLKIVTVD